MSEQLTVAAGAVPSSTVGPYLTGATGTGGGGAVVRGGGPVWSRDNHMIMSM